MRAEQRRNVLSSLLSVSEEALCSERRAGPWGQMPISWQRKRLTDGERESMKEAEERKGAAL